MAGIRFEWDPPKDRANRLNHQVSFEEAQTVFFDERALFIEDPDHSVEEERFLLLGLSTKLNVLLVCHCYREDDQVIRIISARKATRTELHQYWDR